MGPGRRWSAAWFGPLRNPWEWKASMRGGTEMEGHAEVLKLLTGYVQQVPRHFRWRPRVSDGPKGECGGPVLAVGTRTPHGSQHPTLGVRFLNLPQPSLPLLQYNLRKRETPQAVAFPSLRINLLIYADAKLGHCIAFLSYLHSCAVSSGTNNPTITTKTIPDATRLVLVVKTIPEVPQLTNSNRVNNANLVTPAQQIQQHEPPSCRSWEEPSARLRATHSASSRNMYKTTRASSTTDWSTEARMALWAASGVKVAGRLRMRQVPHTTNRGK